MQNRKKILVFTPGGGGGAERMSVLIGKLLPRDLFDVKYVVLGRQKSIYSILPEGYLVDCIPVRNIFEFSTIRIYRKIVKEQPDIVFTSQVAYNPRVILAAKLAGKKVIVRSSGMLSDYSNGKLLGVRRTYPLAEKLIAQQEEMREEMISILGVPSDKVVTIHNPLDYLEIDRLCDAPSPYPLDGIINFVQTASVNYRKGQDVAIKAFTLVKKAIPESHLYFVGGYDQKTEYYLSLQELISDGNLQESVCFVGYDKNPFRWVKNADCFVFPSRAEGLPNALIEASYLGVPCVAARCLNIVTDIIKDGQNGYTVEVGDAEELAQRMIDAIRLKNCEMVYQPGTIEEFSNVFV